MVKENLKKCRDEKGWTQSELAARTKNLTPDWISHFETGRRVPSVPKLIELADALDLTLDELVGRNHERTRIKSHN
ncbi:helix-turn-helix transcriptional regulator [Candidatus Pacearchaeota archaeon]|nr:helix-turn-helix transcriptional regulator [Candidatus Pacearchaeota archaeon]